MMAGFGFVGYGHGKKKR